MCAHHCFSRVLRHHFSEVYGTERELPSPSFLPHPLDHPFSLIFILIHTLYQTAFPSLVLVWPSLGGAMAAWWHSWFLWTQPVQNAISAECLQREHVKHYHCQGKSRPGKNIIHCNIGEIKSNPVSVVEVGGFSSWYQQMLYLPQ